MAEIYRPEKAPERRCELFRWVVAVPGAQSLKNAPSAIVARCGVDPDIRRVFEGFHLEQLDNCYNAANQRQGNAAVP